MELLTGHIMQHTAHHVDSKIPLYRLTGSQSCLESAYPQDIVVEKWTLATLGKTLARCKLYDYENHRWLNFCGKPTSEPNPALRPRAKPRLRVEKQPVKTVVVKATTLAMPLPTAKSDLCLHPSRPTLCSSRSSTEP